MIISRPHRQDASSDASSKRQESVSVKLARLRREQSAQERNSAAKARHRNNPQPPRATPAFDSLIDYDDDGHTTRSSEQIVLSRVAGPRPPKSWIENDVSTDRVARLEEEQRRRAVVSTHARSHPLRAQRGEEEQRVKSLSRLAARRVVKTLHNSRSAVSSWTLDYLQYLPPHLKLMLLDTAAIVAPLDERSIKALLAVPPHQPPVHLQGTRRGNEDEAAAEWDDHALLPDLNVVDPPSVWLTTLNLSFSSIRLDALESILLAPVKSRQLSPNSIPQQYYVPALPSLDTLSLAGTHRLAFSPRLFELLAKLTSLKSLSVAHKTPADGAALLHAAAISNDNNMDYLALPVRTMGSIERDQGVPWKYVLRRLAKATSSTVRHVDVGGLVDHSLDALIEEVDWSNDWQSLETLDVSSVPFESESETRASMRARISRKGRKRWLDIRVTAY